MLTDQTSLSIYRNIANLTEEYCLVCDMDGQVVFINQSFANALDYIPEEVQGKSLYDLIATDEQSLAEVMISSSDTQPSEHISIHFHDKHNHNLLLDVSFCKIDDTIYVLGNNTRAAMKKLESDYKSEIRKAYQIFERSMPDSVPKSAHITFSSFYRPADEIGGDIYDIFKVDNGMLNDFFEQYIVLLIDVTGHGLDSAMLSLFAKETVSQYFDHKHYEGQLISPKEIVNYFIEAYLKERYPEDYFICLFLGVLDVKTEEITYCSAGFQNAPLLTTRDGDVVELACGGLPISSALDEVLMDYPEHTYKLCPGTTFLVCTDGMPEQQRGEEMFEPRLKVLFQKHHRNTPDDIIVTLLDELSDFTSGSNIDDDITLIVAQTPPTTKP